MSKQEKIREGVALNIYGEVLGISNTRCYEIADKILRTQHSQGVVIRVKCPDCEWDQFQDEEAVGMTPCDSCNSTGYIYEPLIEEGK